MKSPILLGRRNILCLTYMGYFLQVWTERRPVVARGVMIIRRRSLKEGRQHQLSSKRNMVNGIVCIGTATSGHFGSCSQLQHICDVGHERKQRHDNNRAAAVLMRRKTAKCRQWNTHSTVRWPPTISCKIRENQPTVNVGLVTASLSLFSLFSFLQCKEIMQQPEFRHNLFVLFMISVMYLSYPLELG